MLKKVELNGVSKSSTYRSSVRMENDSETATKTLTSKQYLNNTNTLCLFSKVKAS